MTGLQASDLTKAKKKQRDTAKQTAVATPPPNQMAGMHAGQMMQHLGYAAAGNQAMTMTQMGFPSSMASALPHFGQIWSGQVYDQNQVNQMQLMAAQAQQQAQQATNMMMAGQQNGAAFFQQQQQAQQTQVQQQAQQVQQPGQPQQAQAGQPQQAQQQTAADGTTVYNGSPQMQSTASPHLNSTSPLNITPQPAAADQQQQQTPQAFEAQISDNAATAATTASTTWSWHDPNAQGQPQQFNVAGQNGPTTQDNGLIAAAAQQAFGESQQQQDNTRRMSNEISQANVGTPQGSEGHRSGQPSPAQGDLGAAAKAGGDASNQAASDPQVQAQQAQSQSPQTSSPQQPVSNQQGVVADPQQAQAQAQQQQFGTVATAHVSYNSYANFPWGNFPAPADNSQGQNGEGEKTQVHSKETMLEAELHHLRSALSEKTKEVQRLGQELEKAYQMIEQLKASQANPGTVGSG